MNIRSNGAECVIELTKSETSRVLEVAYILDRIMRNVSKASEQETAIAQKLHEVAQAYGGKHIGEDGQIKETQRQKLVDESEPDVFDTGK